jgi:hypothetical protein
MKLYHIFISNNLEYEDYDDACELVVAHSMLEAEYKAKKFMEENYPSTDDDEYSPSFIALEVSEIDGYKIAVLYK